MEDNYSETVVTLEGNGYTVAQVAAYYEPCFYALSAFFSPPQIDKLWIETRIAIADAKYFGNAYKLHELFFAALVQAHNFLVSKDKLFSSSLISCHILVDMQEIYKEAQQELSGYFSTYMMPTEGIHKICHFAFLKLGQRQSTLPAYKSLIVALQNEYREIDFGSYIQLIEKKEQSFTALA
jgi:hypothetical protein